jgi:hypothetical protein
LQISTSLEEILGLPKKIIDEKDIPQIETIEELKLLKITNFAYQKIRMVIETAFEVKSHAVESYWLYLGDDMVREILVPIQSVSGAFVSIEPEALLEIKDQLLKFPNYKILGWGHSHADFGVFFSGTDWRNQERLYYETTNYAIKGQKRVKYVYGSTMNVWNDKYAQLTFQFENEKLENVQIPIEIVSEKLIGDISSVIVSDEFKDFIRTRFK